METKTKKPTIYAAMYAKLGRAPTNEELKAEVRRIIQEGAALGRSKAGRR